MLGPAGVVSPRRLASSLIAALALAACGDGARGTPRPTDPRQILVHAVSATAALPTLRLHAEIAATMARSSVGWRCQAMTMAFDADVDLATRQFAGRTTTADASATSAGNGIAQCQQVVRRDRDHDGDLQPRQPDRPLAKIPIGMAAARRRPDERPVRDGGHEPPVEPGRRPTSSSTPRHARSGPATTSSPISTARPRGGARAADRAVPADQMRRPMIPDFDVDVLVDQATSVVSELRTEISMQGTSARILVSAQQSRSAGPDRAAAGRAHR